VLAIIAIMAPWLVWRRMLPVERPLVRLNVDLGPDALVDANTTAAISRDGARLVFPARGPDGKQQLATRLLDHDKAILLPATHRWPQILPGGQNVLFTASPAMFGLENSSIAAVSLKTGERKILQPGAYFGRYLPSGHLVYFHQGVLFGVLFDLGRLEVRGTPT